MRDAPLEQVAKLAGMLMDELLMDIDPYPRFCRLQLVEDRAGRNAQVSNQR